MGTGPAPSTTVIRGGTIWAGGPYPALDRTRDLVIVDGRVATIEPSYRGRADYELDATGCLILPGLINAHTHAGCTPTSRGISEDLDLPEAGAFYHSLVPLLGLGYSSLTRDEFAAVMEWDAIAMLLGGATTIVEENFGGADIWIDLVERLGFRSNLGVTYPGNVSAIGYVHEGRIVKQDPGDVGAGLQQGLDLHQKHHGDFNDRLRIHLSPHAPDTVPEDILVETARRARELETTVHLHVSQHMSEIAAIQKRADMSPVQYLNDIGFLGDNVLATHVTYTDANDWDILAATHTNVVHAAYRKAKEGLTSPYWEYLERGVNVAMATDSFSHDLIENLKLAALFGKVRGKTVGHPGAIDVLVSATHGAARALKRSDLGTLEVGAKGDVIVVDISTPFNAPVFDPLRAFIYYSNGHDLRHSVVDGRPVVENGKVLGTDMHEVSLRVEAACRRLWDMSAAQGALPNGVAYRPPVGTQMPLRS